MSGPLRPILLIALVLVAVIIAAVAVALLASPGDTESYPDGSPEAAVQRYLQALDDRDLDRAYEMLSSSVREETTREEFRRVSRFDVSGEQMRRVRLDDVDITDDRALVHLTVDRTSGSGLDFDRYSYQRAVPLVRESGDWRIDDPFAAVAATGGGKLTGTGL